MLRKFVRLIMKTKIFTLIILLPLIIAAQNSVKIHCTFSAPPASQCSITPSVYFIDEYEKNFDVPIKNNECDFVLTITKPTVAKFSYNKLSTEIFMQAGDEIDMKVGAGELPDAVSFSGKGAAENSFLISFYKKFKDDFDDEAISATIINSDVDAFEMSLYDERKKQLDFFNNSPDKNSFSEAFKKYMENTIRFNYYARLLSFPIIQANQSAQILTVHAFPAVMLNGIDSKLVDDGALNSKSYRDFLYYYDVYYASAANGFNKFTDMSQSMETKMTVANQNFSGESLIWFIAWYLNDNVDKVSAYTAKHIYDMLSLKENKGMYTQLLKSKVDKQIAAKNAAAKNTKLNSGPASSTQSSYPKLKDLEGNFFTFDDLKGKVVYVDYWASWCGPCRMQMPYSKQLHAMFNEKQLKQIVFLYVSIDADENAWKKAINDLGIEGKHGISPGNWNSEIAKYFGINSIPRYMLIDKNGKIVDLNGKRPSMVPDIYNDILKLLE